MNQSNSNSHISWNVLADEKISENKAKYIDELVTVTSLDNNMDSLIEKINSYKKNVVAPIAGIGNLTHVNLGIHLTSFSIDNHNLAGDIYTVDALGNVIIYNSKTFHQRFVTDSENGDYNFDKIHVFHLGLITKLSGISNFNYFEDVGNTMNDVNWKKINLNTLSGNTVIDFTGFSSVKFFALNEGGILRKAGKNMLNDAYPSESNTLLSNIKFHALSLDHKNKILYALDRGGSNIQPNNLYLFYLTDNFEFISNNYQVIKSNSKIYFNNLLVVPNSYNNNNNINSNKKELILVGTQLNDNNEAIKPGYINLYSANIQYGVKNSKLDAEAAQNPKCVTPTNGYGSNIMCGDIKVSFWGVGPDGEKASRRDCEYATRKGRYGNCETHIYNLDRPATLVLTKLLNKEFIGNDILFNRTNSSNDVFNLVAENLENFYKQNDIYDIDRFINIDINVATGDIYILLNGSLFKYPINSLGSNENTRTYEELITTPEEITNLENEIDLLYNNYHKIANTENKLDNKLLLNRNNVLIKKIGNVKKEIKRLNEVKTKNETFSKAVKSSNMESTVNNLQYLVWIILTIITIIIMFLNFFKPDIVPIPVVIIYIIFVSVILIINRNFFKKI